MTKKKKRKANTDKTISNIIQIKKLKDSSQVIFIRDYPDLYITLTAIKVHESLFQISNHSLNPLHLIISMQILHTVLDTFLGC